jgi:hypothetical protein
MTTTHLGGITGNGVMNSLKFVDLGCGAGSCLASALLLSQSQDTNIDNKNESSHSLSPPPQTPWFSTIIGKYNFFNFEYGYCCHINIFL